MNNQLDRHHHDDLEYQVYLKKCESRRRKMRNEKIRQRKIRRLVRHYAIIIAAICFVVFIFMAGINIRSSAQEMVAQNVVTTDSVSVSDAEEVQESASVETADATVATEQTADSSEETASTETSETEDADNTTTSLASGNYQSLGTVSSATYTAAATAATQGLSSDIVSDYGILVDTQTGTILAERNATTQISPASMTKILTVLVAAEHIDASELDDTVQITSDITDFCYQNDCSAVGFEAGETVTVGELFYGTILCSGADAAIALADYVAGSQDDFVELMNEKLDQLGLSDSAHFTNCIGIYDEDHYCTVYDMAMILEAATQNDFCKEIMSTHQYTLTTASQHPDGITISNWFLRRIEDKDTGGTVVCAKTGYVSQSGNCAASYTEGDNSEQYICVTADSTSAWRCIYDQVAIYDAYLE